LVSLLNPPQKNPVTMRNIGRETIHPTLSIRVIPKHKKDIVKPLHLVS